MKKGMKSVLTEFPTLYSTYKKPIFFYITLGPLSYLNQMYWDYHNVI